MSTRVTQPARIDILSEQAPRSTSLVGAFLRRFVRNRLAMIGALIIGVMIILAVFAPLIAPYDPLNQDLDHVLEAESAQHLMGTDDLGRDMLSRIIFGARLSLLAAIYTVGIAFAIGWLQEILDELRNLNIHGCCAGLERKRDIRNA